MVTMLKDTEAFHLTLLFARFGDDSTLNKIGEPPNAGIHIPRVDHILFFVERDMDLSSLLDERLLFRDAHHGYAPVLGSVELCEVVQLIFCLWQTKQAAVCFSSC